MLSQKYQIIILSIMGTISILSNKEIEKLFKPLLMPFLFWVFKNSIIENDNKEKRKSHLDTYNILVYLALFFAYLGDCFLMWEEYFIQGLVAFLVCHLFYIAIIYYETKEER